MALIVRPPVLSRRSRALKAFRPDYVARLGDKVIVGEVKSKERVSSGADLHALASVVNSIPGWRLELIWLGDEPDALPTSDDVERVVERARTVAQVDEEAALLLAWAGVEALNLAAGSENRR
jgi:REase_AHJR-like